MSPLGQSKTMFAISSCLSYSSHCYGQISETSNLRGGNTYFDSWLEKGNSPLWWEGIVTGHIVSTVRKQRCTNVRLWVLSSHSLLCPFLRQQGLYNAAQVSLWVNSLEFSDGLHLLSAGIPVCSHAGFHTVLGFKPSFVHVRQALYQQRHTPTSHSSLSFSPGTRIMGWCSDVQTGSSLSENALTDTPRGVSK